MVTFNSCVRVDIFLWPGFMMHFQVGSKILLLITYLGGYLMWPTALGSVPTVDFQDSGMIHFQFFLVPGHVEVHIVLNACYLIEVHADCIYKYVGEWCVINALYIVCTMMLCG